VSLLTPARLKAFAPKAAPAILAAILDGQAEIAAAGILMSGERLALFLAHVFHETGGLRQLEENLSYSATRLTQVWPTRFPTIASAKLFAKAPEKLANKVYGGRLGNTQPGDGWRYRGSGMLQTTGRSNFKEAGHEADPETLRTPGGALASALVFWGKHGLNPLADQGAVTRSRKVIQGADGGLAEVKAAYSRAKKIFT
jgi:putative chitinase